jgi:hypothetical protein
LPLQHRQPNVTVNTVTTNALHKTICVENLRIDYFSASS